MGSGIRDKVAIIGMGCTKFGERWDAGIEDLVVEAFAECLEDAGIEKNDIQAAYWGNYYMEMAFGKAATYIAQVLKTPHIPFTRVENFCATGTEAIKAAAYDVGVGAHDIVLAIGAEKLKDTGFGGLPQEAHIMNTLAGSTASGPGTFALLSTAYCREYGIEMEKVKTALAHISVKSHANGAMNPKAHLRREVTMEQVLNSPIIAYPLGLFDCCGVSDGAAAAIVTTPEIAKKLKPNQDLITIKSVQVATAAGQEILHTSWDGANIWTTQKAATRAYDEAGITNPRKELSMIEVHDCFSITEFVTMEDLFISPKGGAYEDVMSGFYDLDGRIPCQADGGLKCFGHPIGASGLRMIYAVYEQLLERAPEERKVKNVRQGLTMNLGGDPARPVVSISVIGRG